MRLSFFLIAAFLLLPLHIAQVCGAEATTDFLEETSLEKSYQQAKFYYKQLETNSNLGESRDNWLKGVRNFRKIYLTSPKSELAPASLFMLGRMYYLMYKRFNTTIDLDESLSYYRDVAGLFPQHRLADDALYNVGIILLQDKKAHHKAAKTFRKVVINYPDGDYHNRAAEKLKILSKEYDIPLPNIMTQQSQVNNLATVLPVRYWSSKDYTRVVIKASGPVTYKEKLLEQIGDKPRRLYIDFNHSYIEPRFRLPVPIEDGLLKQIRTGQFSSNTVRVVLDIQSISDYKIFSLPDPFRVVIDVRGQSKKRIPQQKAVLAKTPEKTPADATLSDKEAIANDEFKTAKIVVLKDNKKVSVSEGRQKEVANSVKVPQLGPPLSLAQQLGLGVNRIVLDPGHGGKDPGASAYGMKEKDIVLGVAKSLAPLLEEKIGCEVILTRDDDRFITLEERTAIANTNDADLFISLHINAHPSEKVHGLETYYLNLSTNAEAMRVAARENATSTHQMSDLQDILSDIMKNSKIHESERLAQHVHNSLYNGLKNSPFPKIKSLGVKQAPFYVLIGAEMPAILIEIGFISNPDDAKHLNNQEFIQAVAEEINNGISAYIHATTASL